jgi:hypothetical protein
MHPAMPQIKVLQNHISSDQIKILSSLSFLELLKLKKRKWA